MIVVTGNALVSWVNGDSGVSASGCRLLNYEAESSTGKIYVTARALEEIAWKVRDGSLKLRLPANEWFDWLRKVPNLTIFQPTAAYLTHLATSEAFDCEERGIGDFLNIRVVFSTTE